MKKPTTKEVKQVEKWLTKSENDILYNLGKKLIKQEKKPKTKITMKKNKTWSKMTVVEKRKAIASDVILHTKSKILNIVSENSYCDLNFSIRDEYEFVDSIISSKEFQKRLSGKSSCTVCAMGAMMASDIINRNNYSGVWKSYDIINRFNGIFSEIQLRLIEGAFEQGGDLIRDKEDKRNAIKFGERYKNDKNRLIAIMQNIIDNPKGLFDPQTLKR